MTIDASRIEAEAEAQHRRWEIRTYRLMAFLVSASVLMLLALGPFIGWDFALTEIALCVAAISWLLLASVLTDHLPRSRIEHLRWTSATMEASFGTAALLVCMHQRGAAWACSSPMTLVYVLAIVGSMIRGRPWITIYVAAMATAQWLALYYLVLAPALPAGATELLPPLSSWGAFERAFWFALSGATAAFVTTMLKQTIYASTVQSWQKRELATQLRRFVSDDVAQEVLTGKVDLGRAERHTVTVLFCDLRDFTALCEREAPEAVLRLLNAFYERACKIISAHGGHVNKFMGDGLLAVFGAPDPHKHHARAACEAALQLQVAADELRAEGGIWAGLRVGVGVDTGEVVMGAVGSPDRLEYTAIGSTVNRAARLQALSAAGDRRIIISERTEAAVTGMKDLVPLGEVVVKGIPEPTKIFTFRRAA